MSFSSKLSQTIKMGNHGFLIRGKPIMGWYILMFHLDSPNLKNSIKSLKNWLAMLCLTCQRNPISPSSRENQQKNWKKDSKV